MRKLEQLKKKIPKRQTLVGTAHLSTVKEKKVNPALEALLYPQQNN